MLFVDVCIFSSESSAKFRLKPEGTTPAKFAVLLKSDMAKWEKVVKQSEAKVD